MLTKSIFLSLSVAMLWYSTAFGQDEKFMAPPKPIDNPVMDKMVGTWRGQSDMFGTKMEDTVKISWALNHQFLQLELKGRR